MTDRLRAGIVGAGFIGEVHARAVVAAGGIVAAVAASTPTRAAEAAERLRAERSAARAEELLAADDIDVVHICTPNHLHTALAGQAMAAGKHVVCEKPLATNVEDAQRLAHAAALADVVTAVPFVYRFYPTVREARARVQHDGAASLRLLHGSYLQDWLASAADNNWRVDPAMGGASRAFGDIGVHWCDLIEFTTAHRITRLCARTATMHAHRARDARPAAVHTEDAAIVLFETDHGALGSMVISQVSPGRKNRLWFSLDSTDTSLTFDQDLPDTLRIGTRRETTVLARGTGAMAPAARRYSVVPAGHPQGFQDCFNAFVADTYAAIAGDLPDGLPTFADGYRAAVITAAVLNSAERQEWVEVPA
jgi:predicted dehydrogenase